MEDECSRLVFLGIVALYPTAITGGFHRWELLCRTPPPVQSRSRVIVSRLR